MDQAWQKEKRQEVKNNFVLQSVVREQSLRWAIQFFCGIFYEAIREHLGRDMGDEGSTALSFGIPRFTEIKLVHSKVAQIYRGHPAYRGEDP
jgi:hypothetical protein